MSALTERTVRFLEANSMRWIAKKDLMQKAREAGFSYEEQVKTFNEMKDILEICNIYVSPTDTKSTLPGGEYYMYAPMTPEEKEQLTASLFFFEEMP